MKRKKEVTYFSTRTTMILLVSVFITLFILSYFLRNDCYLFESFKQRVLTQNSLNSACDSSDQPQAPKGVCRPGYACTN